MLLATLLAAAVAAPRADQPPAGQREPAPEIVSREQLDSYLAAHAADNPFNALPAGARERFLFGLKFGAGGLATMNPGELADELDDAQIRAVLALFGERVLAYAPKSRANEVRAVERRVSRRDGIGPLERQYNDFLIAQGSIRYPDDETRARERGALFDARLAALYEPSALRHFDDHELRLLRVAVRGIARETRLRRHVEAFERIFAERARRDLVSTDDVDALRELFVALHRFADARALTQKYPSAKLPPLPQLRDTLGKTAAGPTVWRIEDSGKRLTRIAIDIAPLRIYVAASCHLSKDAARDISADQLLGPVFAQHAQWLVLAPGIESVGRAARWNEDLPRAQVAMLYDREEWAFLPHWRMPTFFIVRDGKVIDSSSGWGHGDAQTRDELVAALRRTGLLPAQ